MFWSFKKKYSLVGSGVLTDMTDIHSHVLPGVDDGSPDVETSLSLLEYMEELGIRHVWLTPHVMEDCPNTPSSLRLRFAALQKAYTGPLQLSLASEYMMDLKFSGKAKDELLPLGSAGDHLLVETSYMYSPPDMDDILLRVWNMGFRPVIAHPERYMYMDGRDYQALKEKGYAFQLNLMSLSGYYGSRPKAVGEQLLRQGMYDFVGTDLHHLDRYRPMLDALKLTPEQLKALETLIAANASI